MNWLESAIAQRNHQLSVALAYSVAMPEFDSLDIELIKRERCN